MTAPGKVGALGSSIYVASDEKKKKVLDKEVALFCSLLLHFRSNFLSQEILMFELLNYSFNCNL